MSIAFNQISLSINTPGVFVEFNGANAVQGPAIQPHVSLLIGQKLSGGSGAAAHPYAIESVADAIALFGEGSQIAQMVAAYKAVDTLTSLFAMGVSDSGSSPVAATGSIAWTGTATQAGELDMYIGGVRVPFGVQIGDTAAVMTTNALAALALVRNLPVTCATDAAAGVTFTARHAGTIGNQIELGVGLLANEHTPAGVTVTVTAMSAGSVDPVLTGVVTAMGEDQYNTIATGLVTSTAVGVLVTELESRWGPMRAIEGSLFGAFYDTKANLATLGASFNSLTFTLIGKEVSALLPLPWENASAVAAASALQAQNDPARALTGIVVAGYSDAARGTRFTRAQRDQLLGVGVSTELSAQDGRLLIERLITTYQTNALSIPDQAFKDLVTVRTLAALRFSLRVRIATKFARFKLTDDGNPIPPGQPIVSPSIIRSEIIMLFQDWQALGWVENLDQFKKELLVQRSSTDPNRVDCVLPPNLINNLLVTAAQIAFRR